MPAEKETYTRVKDGYLEVRMKLQKRASASRKTTLVASTGGNVIIEGSVDGQPVTLGLNAYIKA